MKRREFITLLSAAATWPLAVRAQQQSERMRRIGVLETVSVTLNAANYDALRQGLRELGYVEGRNLVIEYRSADGRAGRFPDLATELVRCTWRPNPLYYAPLPAAEQGLEVGSLAARLRSTERPAVGCTVAPRALAGRPAHAMETTAPATTRRKIWRRCS